jgi:CRP-like cAMP-binding protein
MMRAIVAGQAPQTELSPLIRRLAGLAALDVRDRALLNSLGGCEAFPIRAEMLTEGAAIRRPLAIAGGWACELRMLPDGRRQILGFCVPGDVVGLVRRARAVAISSVMALTAVEAADVSPLAAVFDGAVDGHAALRTALQAAEALDRAYLVNHAVRLGRQTAYERMAHLFLELNERLAAVGLARDGHFTLPLTQEVLADALGLSIVHVNRTLQQLRREKLVEVKGTSAILLRPELLARIADYRRARVVE